MKTILAFLFTTFLHAAQFVFIVPSYNNQDCYKRNLDSILTQSYQNYRVIYIDDASTDLTATLVQDYIKEKNLESKITFIQNEKNVGALANLHQAIHTCASNEIIVNLDGDDWLAHRDVLSQLANVYANPNVWLTHGQFIYYPSYELGFGEQIPQEVIDQNTFRTYTKESTALRTFYAGLFQKIEKDDLMTNGEFFKARYDIAIMVPMLEMAGRHIRFIPEISYVYNINSPLNDFKINSEAQEEVDHIIRVKEKYSPLFHYNAEGPAKRIYITPGYWGQLFAHDNPFFNRDNCLDPMVRLRSAAQEKGYELIQANSLDNLGEFEYLVVFEVFPHQLSEIEKIPSEKLILFLWEPPSVLPDNYNLAYHQHFSKIFTWNDALVDDQKYFKFFYPVYRPQIPNPIDFYFKRLTTLIACNKASNHPQELYSERLKVIHFFENLPNAEFDLYGRNWPNFKNYHGAIGSKTETLKYYRFSYCYENIRNVPGYITEKIFDCFQAASLPVYLGASNIDEYIPRNCYIDRNDFASDLELYTFLSNMSESAYQEYMLDIRAFLASDAAKKYSIENFIETFMRILP